MKRFKFRMEAVFQLRKEHERQATAEVQELKSAYHLIETKISEIKEQRSEWSEAYNKAAIEDQSVQQTILIEQYLAQLDRVQAAQEKQLYTVGLQLNEALASLEKAYQARKQIEKLRDKQQDAVMNALTAKENKEINELGALHYNRKQSGGADA